MREGFEFSQVNDSTLPFGDQIFDVIISNHVIEHVGDRQAQLVHLEEIRRTLKDNGVVYLAVPNRWAIIEPHYKIPFLSWLPTKLRSNYLKLFRKGHFYDCEPLSLKDAHRLFDQAGLQFESQAIQAVRYISEQERSDSLTAKVTSYLPDTLIRLLEPIIPTLIFKLKKQAPKQALPKIHR